MIRLVLFAFVSLIATTTTTNAHILFVSTEAEYARFVAIHDVYRAVIYDPNHLGSLRLIEKLKKDGGHIATVAVLASGVAEFRGGEIPRIVNVDRRTGTRRALEDDQGPPSNLFEYGKHRADVNTRKESHFLLLVGNQLPGVAITAFSEMAVEYPNIKFIYARPSPESRTLFKTFGFQPWKPHQIHHIVNGKSVGDERSFEFSTREEFDREKAKFSIS